MQVFDVPTDGIERRQGAGQCLATSQIGRAGVSVPTRWPVRGDVRLEANAEGRLEPVAQGLGNRREVASGGQEIGGGLSTHGAGCFDVGHAGAGSLWGDRAFRLDQGDDETGLVMAPPRLVEPPRGLDSSGGQLQDALPRGFQRSRSLLPSRGTVWRGNADGATTTRQAAIGQPCANRASRPVAARSPSISNKRSVSGMIRVFDIARLIAPS